MHAMLALALSVTTPWRPQQSEAAERLRAVSAASEAVAWAGGSKGTVLRTTDGGLSWVRVAVPDADALDFRDVQAFDADRALLLSIGPGEASRIYRTTDGGKSWSRPFTNTDPKAFYDAIAFWDARSGLAFGDPVDGRFTVLRTSDGGASWTPVPPANLPPALEGEGAFAASGTCLAVEGTRNAWFATGGAARARVFRSTDQGLTWSASDTPIAAGAPSAGIFSLAFRDARHGIAVGGDYRKERESADNAAVTEDGGATWKPLPRLRGFRSAVAYAGPRLIAAGPAGTDESADGGATWQATGEAGYHALAVSPSGGAAWAAGERGRIAAWSAAAAQPRSVALADGWLFQPDPLGAGDKEAWQRPDLDRGGWRRVAVPMAWDFYEPVMDGYEGIGWYALTLPPARAGQEAWQRLLFGRANHKATVWVDGQKAGENLTGYLPFEVPLSPFLKPDHAATVVVRVENGTRYEWLPGAQVVEWVQYGGLLEPVELISTPPARLAHVALRASPHGTTGEVAASIEVENAAGAPFAGRVRLESDGQTAEAPVRVGARAGAGVALRLSLPDARPWSPEAPALHVATVRLLEGSRERDLLTERFGVRSVETNGRELLLNGRPLRIRGVNRYDEFPGRGPVADAAAIRADLEAVKATGANLIRTHYPQSPVNLAIADELGLLVMEEVPLNWWRATFRPRVPAEYENDRIVDLAEKALLEMVRRDGNHPSLVIWSVANECRTDDELGASAMERLLRRAKALDPTRLVTYVSNQRFEKQRAFALADLVAVNLYFGMWDGETAENTSQLEERVTVPTREALARILKLFPGKPVLLSEFGTIGIAGSGGDVRFSEDYQAAYLTAVWRAVQAVPELSGGVVWSWADYRHRNGFTNDFPTFYGPFGLVGFDRRPKKAHQAMRALWR